MLTFAVFDNQGPASSFELRHAHVCGPDDIVLTGDIEFADGLVELGKRVDGAAALGLQFPVEGVDVPGLGRLGGGLLTLRTCLLPERPAAYLLSLELARHQLMLLLNKLEEWSLFDLAPDDPTAALIERAREAFTHALVVQREAPGSGTAARARVHAGYTLEGDRAARAALNACVAAGEGVAMLAARQGHERRISGALAAAASHPEPAGAISDHEAKAARGQLVASPGAILPEMPRVGVRVNPAAFVPALCEALQANADFVTMPMRWVSMEPTEGKYAFGPTDRWIEWAVLKAKLPVHAGPVLDFHPRSVPDFLFIWENDYETLRDVMLEYLKTIVTRYRRTVQTWTVASGLNVGGTFRLTYEQSIDLTRTAVAMVRKLHPQAKVQVDVAMAWGEYTGAPRGGKSIAPALYAQLLNETQTPFDVLGLRVQMGQPERGRSARDLLHVSTVLDKLARLDKPIAVTCGGVPSQALPDDPEEPELSPGYWRRPWSEAVQAEWLARVGELALSKAYVTSFCWQDLYDATTAQGGEMPTGGLITAQGTARPALRALGELRKALNEKRPSLGVTL
jgi:hypothetical protein